MGQVYPKFSVEAQSVCIVYPLPQVTAEDVDIRLFREKECVIFFKKNRLIHGCEGSSKWSHTTEQGSVTFFLNNVTFLEHGDYLSQVRLSPGDNPIEVTKIFHALQQSENEFKRKRVPAKTEPMEHRESGASDAVNVHLISNGKIFGFENQFLLNLRSRIEDLKVTQDVEDSNIVVIFCPVVSRAGTDIDAALAQIKYPPENKLTVLAMLHHTFEPEKTLANSNYYVQQKNILAVDFLFHEDKGLLDCQKNTNATDKTVNWLIEQAHKIGITLSDFVTFSFASRISDISSWRTKYVWSKQTKSFKLDGHLLTTGLEPNCPVTEFDPSVSHLERRKSERKPDHGHKPETVSKPNGLEAMGHGQSESSEPSNNEIKPDPWNKPEELASKRNNSDVMVYQKSGVSDAVKVHFISNGKIFGSEKQIIHNLLSRIEDLKVTQDVEDSNIVVIFCPVVSRAGTDIDAALAQIKYPPENKLTVLAVLHHTFDPEKTLADSNNYVQQKNILAVDFLFYEDKGLLDCQKNSNATDKTVNWLIEQAHETGITLHRKSKSPSN
ncbi:hypothetical protein DNTS_003418 [Danionella cerebrum]|uniref:Uncharacterized protein n=1 Tax=Danionella cerebrum TaxID=2873325 RepID=A0A553PR78_9TELE|nr:hypothetical protein DNTS_003418 [Danionella translucida]